MTYPLIGNYGRLAADDQCDPAVAPRRSSWRTRRRRSSTTPRQLAALLRDAAIPAIAGVDTRALARHLRDQRLAPRGRHGARRDRPRRGRRSRPGRAALGGPGLRRPRSRRPRIREVGDPSEGGPLIAIVDFGLKENIVRSPAPARRPGPRSCRTRSARPTRWPTTSTASCSRPGPGDPARLDGPVALARAAIADGRPLLGICLGPPDRRPRRRRRHAPAPLRPSRREPPGPRRRPRASSR